MPVDALPDISDTQVIVYTTWPGRSPDLVEDQMTYPIVTALLSVPKVTVVRGFSDFGYSYIYVLFKERLSRRIRRCSAGSSASAWCCCIWRWASSRSCSCWACCGASR
jgi:hypothetical protein